MEMRRCEKGHFYDAKRNPTCPYCNGNSGAIDLGSAAGAGSGQSDMRRCEKGHFYDAKKNSTCPYCSSNIGSPDIPMNRPVYAAPGDIPRTMPVAENIPAASNIPAAENISNIPKTRPQAMPYSNVPGQNDGGRTVNIIKDSTGIDPVVGWLVCIDDPDKGRDYRVHGQRNFIGRAENMDICIRGDNTVSRDTHAILSYDLIKNVFRIYQGVSRGIVYLNEEEVITPMILKQYDVIQVGKTKLMFIPLCGEKFKWE